MLDEPKVSGRSLVGRGMGHVEVDRDRDFVLAALHIHSTPESMPYLVEHNVERLHTKTRKKS
jgi:hypothetical protein